MVARLEIEGRELPDTAELHVLAVVLTLGNFIVGRIRHPEHEIVEFGHHGLQFGVQLLDAGRHILHAGDGRLLVRPRKLRDFLAGLVLLGFEGFGILQEGATALVNFEQTVDVDVDPLFPRPFLDKIGVLPDELDIEHDSPAGYYFLIE